MLSIKLFFQIYIHQEGQLVTQERQAERSYVSKITPTDLKQLSGVVLNHVIQNVVVLRRRGNGIIKCDEALFDEDQKIRQIVVEAVGCIPAYWAFFFTKSNSYQNYYHSASRYWYSKTDIDLNSYVFAGCSTLLIMIGS